MGRDQYHLVPFLTMPLDDAGMHRAGLAFVYRITPVLIATILYGIYISLLAQATRGIWQRGFKNRSGLIILFVLYTVFFLSSALLALEIAQLFGLVDLLLYPNDLSTDAKFARLYALIARETSITGVLFECQMIMGDVLVIWRLLAIWHERKIVVLLPLLLWSGMIVNMIVHASFCRSGVNNVNYTSLCKGTDVAAPVLSIVTNVSVMSLTIWKAWIFRDMVRRALLSEKKNKLFSVFVLLIESGTLYVIMLITDLLVTSLVVGGPESVGRMIDCISGYSTVQFVGIYPTLMIVVLRESIWNQSDDTVDVMSISAASPTRGSGHVGKGDLEGYLGDKGKISTLRFGVAETTSGSSTDGIGGPLTSL
ncbi:hypothetical protein B0H16DRAFT_1554042 [Mycena metata]|uniref:Uncharacterized protein n=1 Tax=Mycena metata TaxID=1033252 RepID=A0AAD7ISK3_9AGAR|nr:hypothetical protein B0H16DRAFT_1605748 [Mycena metata]KAJ7748108.1 hypothetical protein B0H16DRAFT_1554042 [Mycena metata]